MHARLRGYRSKPLFSIVRIDSLLTKPCLGPRTQRGVAVCYVPGCASLVNSLTTTAPVTRFRKQSVIASIPALKM